MTRTSGLSYPDAREAEMSSRKCCGFSGTSLSLSAIRPSSGSERAFIFCISPAAMHLHGGFGDADIAGNLFAEAAARDLNHDLALPGAQRFEALPEGGQSLFILPPSTIAREAELNGVEEVLITERLRQELNGTALHRLHRHRDVAVPCDEDDREFPVRRGELALKIKTALPRQSDVEDQAGGAIRRIGLEKVGNGRK